MALQVQSVAVPGVIPVDENRIDGPDVESIYIPGPAGISVLRARAAAEAAADQSVLSAAASATSAAGALHGYDVRWYGGVAGGTESANEAAFKATVAASLAGGVNRVYIPFDSFPFRAWSVTKGIDAKGCIVAGNGKTALSGIIGAARYDGCVLNTSKQDYSATHPVIPFDTGMKLIKVHSANDMRLLVAKPTSGYSQIILKNNVTTNGHDSLGLTGSDETMWRVTSIQNIVECVVGITTKTDSSIVAAPSSDWSTAALATGIPEYDSGTAYTYSRSVQIGAWAQYQVIVPSDGLLSITLLESAIASSDVTIQIAATSSGGNGVGSLVSPTTLDGNFSTVSPTTQLVTRTYRVKPGTWVIRITNNTVGSTGLNVVGLYYSTLKNARSDIAYDSYGAYRNESVYINPIVQASANDLVLKDYSSTDGGDPGIYGGSFHGGESAITSTLFINGVVSAISSGNLFVGSSVELQQNCTITWSGAKVGCTYSGASVAVYTRTVAILGGYAQSASVTGSFTASELYTTLFGINEGYTSITAPQHKQLDTIANTATLPLGQNSAVEYHYAATGQRLRITHSQFSNPDSGNGGSYIWRVAGSYCKYYSPWVWRGKRDVTSIHAVNVVQTS